MSEPGTIYEVSIVEREPSGRNLIHVLLRTESLEDANALVESLRQDGQRSKLDVLLPGRKKR